MIPQYQRTRPIITKKSRNDQNSQQPKPRRDITKETKKTANQPCDAAAICLRTWRPESIVLKFLYMVTISAARRGAGFEVHNPGIDWSWGFSVNHLDVFW